MESIKEIRTKLNMTQVAMSEALGVDVITLARWEWNNKQPRTLAVRRALAKLQATHIPINKQIE